MSETRDRLTDVLLDEASLAPANPNVEHERRIAVFDLKEANSFAVEGVDSGPYVLQLGVADGRLAFHVSDEAGAQVCAYHLSMSPFRKLIKDYFMICESYFSAIRNATPSQIEAIDMGRRALHNDGAEVLVKAIDGKLKVDFETSRRLFTLICALHVRG
jgi:uncharacterized protein (UPF0262 family)